ncbi:MAG: substrate-binding domain-containing protein [Planctomycetes bacterium]|nr:substrate-binding domain-containing protein [Planctomycetota bacterium]
MSGFVKQVAVIAVVLAGLGAGFAAAAENVLTLATTTSTENSGLLASIHPDFEKKAGVQVRVVAKGTGASLQLARDGNADVVLVHARTLEDRFVAEGFGVLRRDVMYNDFVFIGPDADPAALKGARSPAEALKRIAAGEHEFVSRGDGSGTHLREQELWRGTAVDLETRQATVLVKGKKRSFQSVRPKGDWYLSIGQGMGKTIMVATEKRAYALVDRGTYYALALAEPPRTDLVVVCEGDKGLYNPYGVIAVNPRKHPHVNFAAAKRYVEWITSAEVQKMIGRFRVGGRVLFHPGAGGTRGVRVRGSGFRMPLQTFPVSVAPRALKPFGKDTLARGAGVVAQDL